MPFQWRHCDQLLLKRERDAHLLMVCAPRGLVVPSLVNAVSSVSKCQSDRGAPRLVMGWSDAWITRATS
jgi:hypothetical protein